MKVSQGSKHLGQSIALGILLILATLSIFILMMMQSGV